MLTKSARAPWLGATMLILASLASTGHADALAHLQKCTLVSTDKRWLKRVSGLVPTATLDALR